MNNIHWISLIGLYNRKLKGYLNKISKNASKFCNCTKLWSFRYYLGRSTFDICKWQTFTGAILRVFPFSCTVQGAICDTNNHYMHMISYWIPRIMNREMNSGAYNNTILFSVQLKGFSTFSSTNSIGLKLGMLPFGSNLCLEGPHYHFE